MFYFFSPVWLCGLFFKWIKILVARCGDLHLTSQLLGKLRQEDCLRLEIQDQSEWGQTQRFMPVIPALWEAEASGSPEVRSSWPARTKWWNPVSTKNTKISQVWWWKPIIPAIQEAEAGESLEPRRRRMQWAMIAPLHSSLSNRVRLHLWKKKKSKTRRLTK